MHPFKRHESGRAGIWFLRIASLTGIVASIAAIGVFFRKGNASMANLLIFAAVGCAILFVWSWRDALLAPFDWGKRFVGGVEGDHRHEWYAFKGQRVRVFLDEDFQPWFALNEIVFILDFKVDKDTFRNYTPQEVGIPAIASERCLSERGLRHLIKYSKHRDAGALGLWLARDVLRVLKNRTEAGQPAQP